MYFYNKQSQHDYIGNPRRGVALMLVMVTILITGGMALAYFGSRDNSITISSNVETSARARAVADSGLALVITILETNSNWQTEHFEGILLNNYPLGEGVVTVVLLDSDTQLPPAQSTTNVEITVISTVLGFKQITKARATVIQNEGIVDVDYSEFAVFTEKRIDISDQASIQLWPASPEANGQNLIKIGTLATKPISVQINSREQNKQLELFVTSSASSMVTTEKIIRQTFSDTPPFPNPPPPPSADVTLTFDTTVGEIKNDKGKDKDKKDKGKKDKDKKDNDNQSNSLVLTTGSYKINNFKLIGGDPIEIQGNVIINVKKNFTLKNSAIILSDEATLTIFVGRKLNIDSGYIGNTDQSLHTWMDPNRVRIYGTTGRTWIIKGNSIIKGEIYAPKSTLKIKETATVAGRVAAKTLRMSQKSRILYDQTLDNGGFAEPSSPIYQTNGKLFPIVKKLTSLDPVLIDAIVESLTDSEGELSEDWTESATARPNTVIYTVLVYGNDYEDWEHMAISDEPIIVSTVQTEYDIVSTKQLKDIANLTLIVESEIVQKQKELDLAIATGSTTEIDQIQQELDAVKQNLLSLQQY